MAAPAVQVDCGLKPKEKIRPAEAVGNADKSAEPAPDARISSALGILPGGWQTFFEEIGEPRYRAVQAFESLHKHGLAHWNDALTMPESLRRLLSEKAPIKRMAPSNALTSDDGTVKLLFEPEDDAVIESVIIPTKYGPALCVSSQIGCPVGCLFCQTGQMGLLRSLTADEIVSQFYAAEKHLSSKIETVILMGMGEPMLNVPNVDTALNILTHKKGRALSAKRITVSTVGYPKRIASLAKLGWKYNLALSLHFTSIELRKKYIPVSVAHHLRDIFYSLEEYHARTKADITLEYILLDGINDTPHDARALAYLSRWGWDDRIGDPAFVSQFFKSGRYRSKPFSRESFKVNLIPFNPISPNAKTISRLAGDRLLCPAEEKMEEFFMQIRKYGARVTLRRPRGRDIGAACGMLGKAGKPERQRSAAKSAQT